MTHKGVVKRVVKPKHNELFFDLPIYRWEVKNLARVAPLKLYSFPLNNKTGSHFS